MIRMTTACTREVYDAERARKDILIQLGAGGLRENSVGLIFCNLEFIESGVLEAVCDALPFDVVGCTTQGAAVREGMGHILLTVAVLSGDDAAFATALSDPLTDAPYSRVELACRNAASGLGEPGKSSGRKKSGKKNSMIFAFQPYMQNLRGDLMLRALDAASGGVPVFGTIALDFTTEFRSPRTIHNGRAYSDRLPLLMVSAPENPEFFAESLPPERATISQNDIVTEARDNFLISVNDAPAYRYMEALGLAEGGAFNGAQLSLPVLLDYRDGGKAKACSFYDITPEGFVRCGEEIPVGATFSIGSLGHRDVIDTAKHLTEEAVARHGGGRGGLIQFSCFSRNIVLADPSAEMEAVRGVMARSSLPYLFVHSGGELCPMYDEAGRSVNRTHNYSLIACLL